MKYEVWSPGSPPAGLNQSGFRKGDNTTFQLVRIVQKLSGAIETGQYAFSCFYDLSKAFDRVWHAGLLCKLEHLGVRGKALDWLKDHLTTRQQQVRVNGTPSSRLKIPAGVPQGSVLGRLLFLIYTSDLPEAVADVPGSSCEQFADDTNLTSINSRADLTEDYLQCAINQTASWLRVWRLCVNPQKNRYNGNLPTSSTDTALNQVCPRRTDQSAESPTFGSHPLTRPPVGQSRWSHTDQSNAPAVGPSPTAVIIGPRVPLAHVLNLHQADLGVWLHGMG